MAWVGGGLYFGALDCNGYSAFKRAVRAEKACRLQVGAYHSNSAVYSGSFPIGTEWQDLVIPFDALKRDGEPFDSRRRLVKFTFQPSRDTNGNNLYLGRFKLRAQ